MLKKSNTYRNASVDVGLTGSRRTRDPSSCGHPCPICLAASLCPQKLSFLIAFVLSIHAIRATSSTNSIDQCTCRNKKKALRNQEKGAKAPLSPPDPWRCAHFVSCLFSHGMSLVIWPSPLIQQSRVDYLTKFSLEIAKLEQQRSSASQHHALFQNRAERQRPSSNG